MLEYAAVLEAQDRIIDIQGNFPPKNPRGSILRHSFVKPDWLRVTGDF